MKLIFEVAHHLYRITFEDEKAPYKQLIPTHAPFLVRNSSESASRAETSDIAFEVVVEAEKNDAKETPIDAEQAKEDAESTTLEKVGEFDCGNCLHIVERYSDGGYRIKIHNVNGELAACFVSSADFRNCHVKLSGSLTNQRFGLDNSIMIAFAFATATQGTLLMHSSVAVKDNRGYLFQGKSGTGKSTHCELWLKHIEGTERINDDNPVVRIMPDGKAWVYGSPWSGKTPIYLNVGYPIGGFLRLHQAPHNKIRTLSALEGFASVLSSCSTMIWDKPTYSGICNTISRLMAVTKCFDLECLPDEAAAKLSYSTMSQYQ